jgi:hypothetical protein
MAYKIDSIGEPAAVMYLLSTPGGFLFLLSVVVAIVAVVVQFVLPHLK